MNPTKRYAVAGFPVSHSKSPLIFNQLFSTTGFPGIYSRISAASREEAAEMFTSLGLSGMNITAPLKSEMMNLAENTDEAADRIGGINTLVYSNGIMTGFNTDHLGVSGTLSGAGIPARGKKCLVLGAGNAGRAAVYALNKMGGHVTVINRSYKKAHILAGDMNCRHEVIEKLHAELSDCDIFISAMSGGREWVRGNQLNRETVVFDADYLQSPLREIAGTAGCRYIPGEAWLWHQAVPVFGIFTGEDFPESAREDILELLGKTQPPVSRIRLAGDKTCIQSVEEEIRKQKTDIETDIAGSAEDFNKTKSEDSPGGRSYNVLIYSGNPACEDLFFHHSDLIVWGRGGIKDCTERILREISHVR